VAVSGLLFLRYVYPAKHGFLEWSRGDSNP
jgi:hypothetical protein